MKTIKLTKKHGEFPAGLVISVDDSSATKLVGKGVADLVTGAAAPRPVNLSGQPTGAAPADVDGDAALTRDALKADLVAAAQQRGIDGAEAMTKAELADALGLE